ncbi:intradiol ring-cleavage dioxygenase [Streptomyces venezuelae]|uniref:Intradiol ring-cleavage dioxygenase n=1 Tax=Streptomyces venezuelae TaxID=54571 RepID=A0A5P2DB25_STRVZ|nr:intradiol ring-cleavage dioxygenase [Streptomyces venezuelae]QES50299.1 intradiol ring-cleavage dioxygenase [Streptomyces venezuelae]
MTDDDTSRTSRRTLLLAAGSAGLAGLAGLATACSGPAASGGAAARQPAGAAGRATTGSTPGCVLTPESGEGPYYVAKERIRSDITEGQTGVPLRLDLTVVGMASGCRPMPGVEIDVWQAGSDGEYSIGKASWLRGTQVTDGSGRCVFRTIVPGWYAGLAPHIHFKVRPDARSHTTSVFYLPEDMLLKVYAAQPYARRKAPAQPNGRDARYRDHGRAMTLAPVTEGTGYRAAFTVGIA